jgi:hypothetical protein
MMDKKQLQELLDNTENSNRVIFELLCDGTLRIKSKNNTNDTWGWFHINSEMLEDAFRKMNLSWCYIFETAPQHKPIIYLLAGETMTREYAIKDNRVEVEMLPEGREMFFEAKPFSLIDKDKYDNSLTELEKLLRKSASDVIEVYEA